MICCDDLSRVLIPENTSSHLNSPVPGVLRLCAVVWLCSLALIKYRGDPMTAPAAPHAAPAARFLKKNAVLLLVSGSAPNTAWTGANRDSRVPFIRTWRDVYGSVYTRGRVRVSRAGQAARHSDRRVSRPFFTVHGRTGRASRTKHARHRQTHTT